MVVVAVDGGSLGFVILDFCFFCCLFFNLFFWTNMEGFGGDRYG